MIAAERKLFRLPRMGRHDCSPCFQTRVWRRSAVKAPAGRKSAGARDRSSPQKSESAALSGAWGCADANRAIEMVGYIRVPSGTQDRASPDWRVKGHRNSADGFTMGRTYTKILLHAVFSTKERQPWLAEPIQERLWPYLGGIANQHRVVPLCIGGMADHVHALLGVPTTLAVADMMQYIKGGSSKWLHEEFPDLRSFAWQEGYGAFSVGVSGLHTTTRYINNQKSHHKQTTFKEEFLAFLKRHDLPYDPRYIWD